MPFCSPASRISIPSVKMNALKPAFTIRIPFTSPTAAPIASSTRIPATGLQFVPSPCAALGTISQAPIIGARP